MNEQIRQLAVQAGYNPSWSTKADKEEHFDLEQFAELIVRECADVADGHWRNQCPGLYVKEHFGFEE